MWMVMIIHKWENLKALDVFPVGLEDGSIGFSPIFNDYGLAKKAAKGKFPIVEIKLEKV